MLAGQNVILLSLNDFPDIPEIEEDGSSYLENALKKARTVSEFTGETVLADDSGLEVDALGGAPGIYSSRYAGDHATDEDNIRKLLKDLQELPTEKRSATFHCELVYYQPDGSYEVFSGCWAGRINYSPLGEGGFGYDPVFFLPDRNITVSQLTDDVKNKISHRALAFAKFKEWFKKSL
jgi:XTP/dITP diphosphohydrolase